jgi:DNA-binding NtrC family response regulator
MIDQDLLMLELYRRELGQDFDMLISSSHEEAISKVMAGALDAVVLEPVPPNGKMWDWQLLDEIFLGASRGAFPVVLCSLIDERKRSLDMGAASFLLKPVLPLQLSEVLHKVIQKGDLLANGYSLGN